DADYNLKVIGGDVKNIIGVSTNSPELEGLIAFPNPVSGILNFDVSSINVDGTMSVTIYDLLGKKIKTAQDTKIDVSDIAAGLHYYRVEIGLYTTVGKVMIIK
ncbi:MAG: T9SS type A sorting domain-containing protein, partial [Saprospiraceae bacterium]